MILEKIATRVRKLYKLVVKNRFSPGSKQLKKKPENSIIKVKFCV